MHTIHFTYELCILHNFLCCGCAICWLQCKKWQYSSRSEKNCSFFHNNCEYCLENMTIEPEEFKFWSNMFSSIHIETKKYKENIRIERRTFKKGKASSRVLHYIIVFKMWYFRFSIQWAYIQAIIIDCHIKFKVRI